ncbi:MAG: hypothetical protein PUD24_01540, partial [Oscillospiraceae bacterium]|nr:hypothetical protein [Oscillospiraceae bacterium]
MTDFSKYYRAYMYMQEILTPDFTHKYLERCMEDSDKGEDVLTGKTNEKVIDMDWVIAFEDALPYIQKAIDEQRRFIKQVDNVVRVEKAKKITTDSVKHLAQHTNFIAKVEGDKVTPNKILNVEREESFEIYENRFLFTLINNALRFVEDKYANLKNAPTDSYNEIKMKRHLVLNQQVVDFSINYTNESHETTAEDLDVIDVSTLSDFDRIRRIRQTLNDFLSTPLMKALVKCTLVRPPIQQTNLLKKNPNFKKAVELWNFLESYKKKGFEVVGEEFSGAMPKEVQNDLYMAMGFEHFMLSISTNPGLRRLLQEKYEEENQRLEEEKKRPADDLRKVLEAQIYARYQEEMEGYLKEIREREKKIIELNSEIKNLKMIVDQREQQIQVLKGQVSALKDQVEKLEDELKKLKLKLMEAENKIKEQEEIIARQKLQIEQLTAEVKEKTERINVLEQEKAQLENRVASLTEENAALKSKLEECENKIVLLESQVADLTGKLKECQAEISELKSTVSRQENTISAQKDRIENLESKNTELENSLNAEIESHKADVENQKNSYEAMLSDQKAAYESEITTQKADFEKQISDTKSSCSKEISNVRQACEAQIESEKQSCKEEIFNAKKDFEAKLLDSQISFDKEKKDIQSANSKQLESQRKLYESKIASVNKEKDKAYSVEERKFKSKLVKLEKQMNMEYNRKIKEIKAQAAK